MAFPWVAVLSAFSASQQSSGAAQAAAPKVSAPQPSSDGINFGQLSSMFQGETSFMENVFANNPELASLMDTQAPKESKEDKENSVAQLTDIIQMFKGKSKNGTSDLAKMLNLF